MYKYFASFIVPFCVTAVALAQDSVIPDVSYPYLNKLIVSAKTHYPRVEIFKNRVDLAKYNISKANVSWFDIFTASYIYQPNSNTTAYNTIPSPANPYTSASTSRYLFNGLQLGVSLNIGSVLAKSGTIKAAKEGEKIAEEEQSEYLITLESDVKRRYFTYLLQQNLVKIQTQAYQDVQSSIQQAKYKFQKGEITFEVYNAALLNSTTRIEQKLQAEANLLIAKSDLESVVGAKLEEIK